MRSTILNVAVVGCGIGREHIEEGYAANPDRFRVHAICDINEKKRDELAVEFGVPRRTSRFEDLLDMEDLDIIDICTPPGLHYEQILAALSAGKHVICEKPLVGSLEQMDAIIAAEASAAGRLMPIFQYRFGNGIEQAKRIIDSGLAGKPYMATAETFWTRGADYYAVPWRGKWETELGGMLMSHAIHIHDMMLYLMGPATALFGRTATRVNDIETEDCVSASLQFASGALGTMAGTLGSREQISRLRLAWENVTIESDQAPYGMPFRPWRIIPANDDVGERIAALLAEVPEVLPGYGTQFARFHDALFKGTPLPVSSADARRSLEVVAAFYHSSRTRSDVSLPIGQDHPIYKGWVPESSRR